MAENETLDFGHRNSGRWRALEKTIERGAKPEEVAGEFVRCLVNTVKRVVERVPLAELLDAAKRKDDHALANIVRYRCKDARDYAELLQQAACVDRDASSILDRFLRATVRAVLRRIEVRVDWPTRARLRLARPAIESLMNGPIVALARKVAAHPDQKPSLPPRSAEQRQQDHEKLLLLSLRHKER